MRERRQGLGKEDLQPGKSRKVVERGRFGKDLSAGELGLVKKVGQCV